MEKENKYIRELEVLFRTEFHNSVDSLTKGWQKKGTFYRFHSSNLEDKLKYFLLKILKSQRKEIIEKIEKERDAVNDADNFFTNIVINEIINLIKENDTRTIIQR